MFWDTKKNSDWPAGSRERIATDHMHVPSPMIGQYKLDSLTNWIRDTGMCAEELCTIRNPNISRDLSPLRIQVQEPISLLRRRLSLIIRSPGVSTVVLIVLV